MRVRRAPPPLRLREDVPTRFAAQRGRAFGAPSVGLQARVYPDHPESRVQIERRDGFPDAESRRVTWRGRTRLSRAQPQWRWAMRLAQCVYCEVRFRPWKDSACVREAAQARVRVSDSSNSK